MIARLEAYGESLRISSEDSTPPTTPWSMLFVPSVQTNVTSGRPEDAGEVPGLIRSLIKTGMLQLVILIRLWARATIKPNAAPLLEGRRHRASARHSCLKKNRHRSSNHSDSKLSSGWDR